MWCARVLPQIAVPCDFIIWNSSKLEKLIPMFAVGIPPEHPSSCDLSSCTVTSSWNPTLWSLHSLRVLVLQVLQWLLLSTGSITSLFTKPETIETRVQKLCPEPPLCFATTTVFSSYIRTRQEEKRMWTFEVITLNWTSFYSDYPGGRLKEKKHFSVFCITKRHAQGQAAYGEELSLASNTASQRAPASGPGLYSDS